MAAASLVAPALAAGGWHRHLLAPAAAVARPTTAGAGTRPAADVPAGEAGRAYRQPVSVVADGSSAFVADVRGGSVSVVDLSAGRVTGEIALGGRISDVTTAGTRVLACDEAGGRLVVLHRDGGRLALAGSVAVGTSPVVVRAAPDGSSAVVSLLWARRVAVVSLADGGATLRRTVDLPFAPRALLWLGRGDRPRVLVADAFGGRLAVVDPAAGRVESLRSVDGQAIGGLALSADGRRVLVSLSLLDEKLETTASHISWGGVVSNLLREVAVDELLPAGGDAPVTDRPVRHWTVEPLGETGNGAADPAGVVALPKGGWAVALGGVGQVSVRRADGTVERVPVGRGPAGLAAADGGRLLVVANRFDDTLTVLDPATGRAVRTIPLGTPPAMTEADRGEVLFHDGRLSHQHWMSCASCHPLGHMVGRLNDNASDGTLGSPKRILSARGLDGTAPFAWNGSRPTLSDQVRQSVVGSMQAKPELATDEAVGAIAAYLRSLPPPPGVDAARGAVDPAAAARGRAVFDRLDCGRCHDPARHFTGDKTYDVGLADPWGLRKFNPPPLTGVSQRDALLHDASAASVEDLFGRVGHPDGARLDGADLRDLVAFLRSL